jgi:membrane associated rhomboid family serine protease
MVFIGLWFVMQFISGIGSLGTTAAAASGGVAWWAHVGGFLLGMLIAFIMSLSSRSVARY